MTALVLGTAMNHTRHLALAFTALALFTADPAAAKGPKAGAPIALPAPKSLDAAIAALEKATASRGTTLELGGAAVPASEGRAFSVDGKVATRLLVGSHERFLQAGLYLFRLERSFGMAGGKDVVALVKTSDRDALLRRVGTTDPAKKLTTEQIAGWLAALEQEEPFLLDEIGLDFVAGRFRKAPKDPAAVARRCAEVAPELVKGSGSAIGLLTEEIRANRTLYLIW